MKILLVLSIVLTGCVSYTGPLPNFDAQTEDERKREYQRFYIDRSLQTRMGGTFYNLDSLLPVVRSVSPQGYVDVLNGTHYIEMGGALFLGGAAIGERSRTSKGRTQEVLEAASTVATIAGVGLMIWGTKTQSDGIEQYDFDLRMKFLSNNPSGAHQPAPGLEVSTRF